ncbi:MAG: phosphomannomutase/phosphoglucomutase, partial [Eubacteriales bacterium]
MLEKRWSIFKSGSDIRGFGISCGSEPLYLSDEVISQITYGFALWLSQKINKSYDELIVSVGHDSRLSAPHIKKYVINTLSSLGIHVIDCGLSSTPAMFMTTVDLKCSGAMQITASHHPYDRNGLKFFTRAGGLEGSNIDEILEFAQNERFTPIGEPSEVEPVDYMNTYAANLREMICREVNDTDYF